MITKPDLFDADPPAHYDGQFMWDVLEHGIMSGHALRFTVTGKPEPKGSTRMVPVRGRGAVITSDNVKLAAWQRAVAWTARSLAAPMFPGAVAVVLEFRLTRPTSLPRRCTQPVRKPDVDKLARAVLDALVGVLVVDDARVVELHACKAYGAPGVDISVGSAEREP